MRIAEAVAAWCGSAELVGERRDRRGVLWDGAAHRSQVRTQLLRSPSGRCLLLEGLSMEPIDRGEDLLVRRVRSSSCLRP